jgi:hypothetical protein
MEPAADREQALACEEQRAREGVALLEAFARGADGERTETIE